MKYHFEKQRIEPRYTRPLGGIDHGSQGVILSQLHKDDKVLKKLVWFKGHKTAAAGVRGFGHIYHAAQLAILDENSMTCEMIFEGGRLSVKRLNAHASDIDKYFGKDTSTLIRLKETLIIEVD